MYEVVVMMLPVGQGGMNLIEIYYDKTLISLSLIDCGGDVGAELSKQACACSLDYVAGKMLERWNNNSSAGSYAALDTLVITHRDRDHWNLLKKLFTLVLEKLPVDYKKCCFYNDTDIEGTYFLDGDENTAEVHLSDCGNEYGIMASISICKNSGKESVEVCWEYSDDEIEISGYWNQPEGEEKPCVNITWVGTGGENEYREANLDIFMCSIGGGGLTIYFDYPKAKINSPVSFMEAVYREVILPSFKKIVPYFPKLMSVLEKIYMDYKKIEEFINTHPCSGFPIIRRTYVGGNTAQKGPQLNSVLKLIKFLTRKPDFFETSLDKAEVPLIKGIELYFVKKLTQDSMVNLPGAESKSVQSIINNSTSIVSALICTVPGVTFQKVVFCGDATVHTFYQMLQEFEKNQIKYNYQDAIWTAPHHGAYRTLAGKIPGTEKEVFPSYMEKLVPQAMVVSAGVKNTHGHPCEWFVSTVLNFLKTRATVGQHEIYANKNNSKKGGADWHFLQSIYKLYTTYTKNGSEKYMTYRISCMTASFGVVDVGNLLTGGRSVQAIDEHVTPEMPLQMSKQTEIPSGDLFFYR